MDLRRSFGVQALTVRRWVVIVACLAGSARRVEKLLERFHLEHGAESKHQAVHAKAL